MLLFSIITEQERSFLGNMIERVAEGDDRALASIYESAGGRLFSVALGLTRDRTFAEDVLQESFLKIVKAAPGYRAGTNGYAWLCTVVRTTALTMLKVENRKKCADIDSFFSLEDGDRYGASENAMLVEKAFTALNSREKLAVWLKYYNEMTVREIAEEMEIGKSTAADLILKAEEKMRGVFRTKSGVLQL